MRVDDQTLASITSHALGAYPRECCGIIGARAVGGVLEATTLYPARNAAPNPETMFVLHPDDQREIMAQVKRRGEHLAAIYHSHPRGRAEPSSFDLELAALWPHAIWLIVAVDRDEMRYWRVTDRELVEVFRDPVNSTIQEVTR